MKQEEKDFPSRYKLSKYWSS